MKKKPTNKLTRAAKIKVSTLEGSDILAQGHETARQLWNTIWWHQIGYNRKLQLQREGLITVEIKDPESKASVFVLARQSMAGRHPKYTSEFGMVKELKDHWSCKNLSDRCSSYTIKAFDTAMRSWFSNLKTNRKMRPPRYCDNPRQLTFEVGRNAKSIAPWTYKLTVLGGHIKDRHCVVRISIQDGLKMKDIKLIRIQPDGSGTVTYSFDKPPLSTGINLAAIDLGIINIATVVFSDGKSIVYSGKKILESNQWANKKVSQCKPSNWKPGAESRGTSKKSKRYQQKATANRNLAVHNLTRSIVAMCVKNDVYKVVVGDLKGIRDGADWGGKANQRLHAWPFAEVARQLQYKLEAIGIELVKVNERGTSANCHICGKKGIRNPRGMFKCNVCGMLINSDINGAYGILNKIKPDHCALIPSPNIKNIIKVWPQYVGKFEGNWSIKITEPYKVSPSVDGVAAALPG